MTNRCSGIVARSVPFEKNCRTKLFVCSLVRRCHGQYGLAKSFSMPVADMFLNAAVPAPERPFATLQSYVMVTVLDEEGNVVPGFEAEKCRIVNDDRSDIPLKWGDASLRQLAGQTVRLRFFLRSANIYAVTARE